MKLVTIMGVLNMLTQVKELASDFNPSGKRGTVEHSNPIRILDYHQCKYVKLVYCVVSNYNILDPQVPLSDDDMVVYFNHLFNADIPLEIYERIWSSYQH